MTLTIIILSVGILCFFYLYRIITKKRVFEDASLESQRNSAKNKYQFMLNHRRDLKDELADKERALATLRNSQEGIKTISAKDLDIDEVDENDKVSRYLIQEGKITLEQNEKVLKKMQILQMDYIGVCLTLGFIDLKTAKKAIKINKIVTNSPGLI